MRRPNRKAVHATEKDPVKLAFRIDSPSIVRSRRPNAGTPGIDPGRSCSGRRCPIPTLKPSASSTASRVPLIVSPLLVTVTVSRYVPAGTTIVSPGDAASTAAWIVVVTTTTPEAANVAGP